MNSKELAEKMLKYSDMQLEADVLRAEIEAEVLKLGKTQEVGNVKAQFRNGRKSYDYKSGAKDHPMVNEATVKLFTKRPAPIVDWRGICSHVGIEDVPFSTGNPSVKVSLTTV